MQDIKAFKGITKGSDPLNLLDQPEDLQLLSCRHGPSLVIDIDKLLPSLRRRGGLQPNRVLPGALAEPAKLNGSISEYPSKLR